MDFSLQISQKFILSLSSPIALVPDLIISHLAFVSMCRRCHLLPGSVQAPIHAEDMNVPYHPPNHIAPQSRCLAGSPQPSRQATASFPQPSSIGSLSPCLLQSLQRSSLALARRHLRPPNSGAVTVQATITQRCPLLPPRKPGLCNKP